MEAAQGESDSPRAEREALERAAGEAENVANHLQILGVLDGSSRAGRPDRDSSAESLGPRGVHLVIESSDEFPDGMPEETITALVDDHKRALQEAYETYVKDEGTQIIDNVWGVLADA
ncbi:hypothetical protein AB0I84_20855 [Streptomyces spectabilis]|uniref:hypothetical protein n=1 Tax=Streptomyces spectabilis TaxID=68270 RepID=UPI00340D9390